MTINSTNQAPYEVMLDLIQSVWSDFVDDAEPILSFVSGRPLLQSDPIPSMFSIPISCEIEQRTIPENKTTLDIFEFEIRVYTYKAQLQFTYQQILKQILISNNKIQETQQYSNSGIEWTEVVKFDYKPILLSEEHVFFEISCTVKCAFQDSYLL